MANSLTSTETVESGLKRIALAEFTAINKQLRRFPAKKPVHEARKGLKKVRALLRLVRPHIPGEEYRRQNRICRDTARVLSACRDEQVLDDTINNLMAGPLKAKGRALAPVWHGLKKARRSAEKGQKATLEESRRGMQAVPVRFQRLKIQETEWKALKAGIAVMYRQARAESKEAGDDSPDATLHEWRKSVKYLRLQLEFLEEAWPAVLHPLVKELHHLSNALGEHHDLTVLCEALTDQSGKVAQPPEKLDWIYDAIAVSQAKKKAEALALGRRCFAEKPKAFQKRLAAYWQTWRRAEPA